MTKEEHKAEFNTLKPRQNGRHFADDIFNCIFLNENVWILIKISLKFVPKGPINNIPALVQIMAWRRPGDKLLSEPMVVSLLTHICVTRPQWVNSWQASYGVSLMKILEKINRIITAAHCTSNVENTSMSWHHHDDPIYCIKAMSCQLITWAEPQSWAYLEEFVEFITEVLNEVHIRQLGQYEVLDLLGEGDLGLGQPRPMVRVWKGRTHKIWYFADIILILVSDVNGVCSWVFN